MEKSVTRRNFLIGGAAVSGIAALGLVGCSSTESSSGTPTAETGSDQVITPTYPAYARTLDVTEKDIVRTEDADVVVVGSGSAGTFAAIRAAERGAHVIWLEKTTAKGGTSTITEGLTAFDGEQQRATGEASDLNGIYTALMDWHNWGAKTEAFQTYFDFSGKAVDWAVSHGASLVYSGNPKKPHYSPVDAQGNWMNIGTGVLTPLWEYGETLDNLDFRLETPAVNIIVDNGTVKGVYAQEADGIVRINAKSVIMATGGFASNVDMGKEWLRVPAERIKFMSFEGQDGDGINMALAAGAARHAPTTVNYGLTTIEGSAWDSQLTIFTVWCPSWRVDMPDAILPAGKPLPFVNHAGVRFYNEAKLEELNTSMLNTAVSSQKAAFAVFDADHVATYGGFGDFNYGSGISEGDFAKERENSPAVFVDDTLEGLAAQMGIDTTAFTTTIAEYNDHAATGTDADSFGTMPGEKTPVLKAPFYAAKIVACAYGTNGGVSTDYWCRAVNSDGDIVEGLYAAGQDNGSMYFNDYPYGLMGGTCQGGACTTGFVCAESACDALGL